MAENISIKISNVSKKFGKDKKEFYALKDISFTLQNGDVLGIIGKNGSGKSTLLKILSGIYKPDSGNIDMYGSIASILDVGAGMHPDLTGKQNVYLRGQLLGLKKKEIDAIYDDLVAFSEVEDFLDTPVKHYSSGMFVRLAFSIVVFLKADILILDEVMSVGDVGFMEKCNRKLLEMTENRDTTVILVGHNVQQIYKVANKAITLHEGEIVFEGDTAAAIEEYIKLTKPYFSQNTFDSTGIKMETCDMKVTGDFLHIAMSYTSTKGDFYPVIRIKKLNQEVFLIDGTKAFKAHKDSADGQNNAYLNFNVKIDIRYLNGGDFFVHYFFANGEHIFETNKEDSFKLGKKEYKQDFLLSSEHLVDMSFQ